MERLPFENEERTVVIKSCTKCNASEGEFHTLGCPFELCPACGGEYRLIDCDCRVLSPYQEIKVIDAIKKELTIDYAMMCLEEMSLEEKKSYEESAIMRFVIEYFSGQFPHLSKKLNEIFERIGMTDGVNSIQDPETLEDIAGLLEDSYKIIGIIVTESGVKEAFTEYMVDKMIERKLGISSALPF